MSKKHIEEQKLLIENFNKWISEAEQQIETIENLSEEKEVLNEIVFVTLFAKLLGVIWSLLSFYDDLTDINKEIQNRKDIPPEVKKASQTATDNLTTLKDNSGIIGRFAKAYGSDLNPLTVKQNIAAAIIKKLIGSGEQEKPEPEPEPEPEAKPVDNLGNFYKDVGIEESTNE